MNLEEVLGRVTNPADKAFLEKMIKDQNSYITKLENQLKSTAAAQPDTKATPSGMDSVTYKYLEQKMREDIISSAERTIVASIDQPMFEAVKPDWLEFLKANMDTAHTTVEYAVDAFNLVLGRCLRNKDHAVNNLGKGTTPNPTPTPQTAGTNAQGVQTVNSLIQDTPPTMTNKDINVQPGIPAPQPNEVKNTKSAFDSLKARLGGNKNPFQ